MPNLDSCEVCGREAYHLVPRNIAGVILKVCDDCSDLGEEPRQIRKKASNQRSRAQQFQSMMRAPSSPSINRPSSRFGTSRSKKQQDTLSQLKVIDDAIPKLIKLRSSQGLSTKEFSNELLIKENYYKRIEKGTTALPIDLARKIEKKYKITLVELEDLDESEETKKFMAEKKDLGESMIYFKKRGQKPEYDQ